MNKSQNGKGSTPRKVDLKTYWNNYDLIFRKECWEHKDHKVSKLEKKMDEYLNKNLIK